jgi:hypothetical protein
MSDNVLLFRLYFHTNIVLMLVHVASRQSAAAVSKTGDKTGLTQLFIATMDALCGHR